MRVEAEPLTYIQGGGGFTVRGTQETPADFFLERNIEFPHQNTVLLLSLQVKLYLQLTYNHNTHLVSVYFVKKDNKDAD